MKNKNILIIIGIILALCIIGVCTYLILDKSNSIIEDENKANTEEKKEETDTTSKATEKADKNNYENSTKEISSTIDSNFPGFKKIEDNVETHEIININSKKLKISYESTDEDLPTYVGKINNTEFVNNGLSFHYNIYYRIITGNDNKEYMLIGLWHLGNYFKIYNDEGKIIYEFSDAEEELGCHIHPDSNNNFLFFKNDSMYFYKYVNDSKDSEKIKLKLIKVNINDSIVKEESVNTVIDGTCGNYFR